MLSNALISIAQTTMMVHPSFMRMIDPKMLLYQFMIRMVEYDKVQSEAVVGKSLPLNF